MQRAIKPLSVARSDRRLKSVAFENARHFKQTLEPAHEAYVRDISRADMAASLEVSALLAFLCNNLDIGKAVDFGSGFSSFVLRCCASESRPVEVWSVDDDSEWIEKTRSFLEANSVSTENLVMLNTFLERKQRDFDLVFLDLNFVEVRKEYIGAAVDCCKSGGVIIFDDVHKQDFLYHVLSDTRDLFVSFYDIKPITLDKFGRFSLLGIKA